MRNFFERLHPVLPSGWPQLPLPLCCLLATLAGAAMTLALAPFGYWLLALLSPAVLYALLHDRRARQGGWIGWSYGFGLWLVGSFWLYTAMHVYGDTPAPLALLLMMVLASIMGLFNALPCWLYRRYLPQTPLTFAPLWILGEWLKTWLFTGFPWLFVGYAFVTHGLDQYAPLLGVFGVSFVAVLLGAALVEILRGKWFWAVPVIILGLGAWGSSRLTWVTPKPAAPLTVSLIQGNIPQDLKWLVEYQAETLRIYATLSQTEWGRDLVVWPEASIPMFQNEIQPFLDVVSNHARSRGSAWVTGIPYWDDRTQPVAYYNAIMARGAESSGLYFKQRLVPFGEYIPLAGALSLLPGVSQTLTASGFSQGAAGQPPLMIKGHRLATAICYEIAYPNLTRRNAQSADFLVTISNDAWFTGTYGPWQHLQMAQMRAKENGRWIIRATNTGVTAFIDQQGRLQKQLPMDKRRVLRGNLPAYQGQTPYSRWGDVPVLLLSLLLLAVGRRYVPRVVDTRFKQRR